LNEKGFKKKRTVEKTQSNNSNNNNNNKKRDDVGGSKSVATRKLANFFGKLSRSGKRGLKKRREKSKSYIFLN
jgi:hypothetical protein